MPLEHTQVALFEKFMENYAKVVLAPGDSLPSRLFVVCFLPPGSNDAKTQLEGIISKHEKKHPEMVAKVMLSSETYSRGLALQLAVDEVTFTTPQGDHALLFFAAPDLRFSESFMFRCRSNCAPGKRAYWPMSFSMYPPDMSKGPEQAGVSTAHTTAAS